MSKPYRIRVDEMVSAQDTSRFHIDPLPLVTPETFVQMMEAVLEEAGWQRDEEGSLYQQDENGETHVFLPDRMQIVTIVEEEAQVKRALSGWDHRGLRQAADKLIRRAEKELESKVTDKLDEGVKDRRLRFEEHVVEATGRAIKEAATRLGDVQDMHEDRGENGEYRLTITIQERE